VELERENDLAGEDFSSSAFKISFRLKRRRQRKGFCK
jgi:hypothetical protein